MSKKAHLRKFPILILSSVIFYILFCFAFDYFKFNIIPSLDRLKSLALSVWISVKDYRSFLFPIILFFTIAIVFSIINRCVKKSIISEKNWFWLEFFGIIIMLFADRILFLVTGAHPFSSDALKFILSAFNKTSLLISAIYTFILSFVVQLFDVLFLNSK